MVALLLLVCGAAPPAVRDASLPEGAVVRLDLSRDYPAHPTQALAFWPCGKVLAAATSQGVRLWHLPTRRWHRFVPGPHAGSPTALLDARGRTALFVGRGGEAMHAYDLLRGRALPAIASKSLPLAVALSGDGTVVARAEADGARTLVRAWETATGHEKVRFWLPARAAKAALALSPDGKLLAAVLENDKGAVIYSGLVRTANCREVYSFGGAPVLCLAFSPDGKALAVIRAGAFYLHDGATGRPKSSILEPGLAPELVSISPDGRLLALASPREDKLTVYEIASGTARFRHLVPARFLRRSLAFSPGGSWLAAAGEGGRAVLWDMTGRHELRGGIARATMDDLSSPSAEAGRRAIGQLLRSPREAVSLLRSGVPVPRAPRNEEQMKLLLALAGDSDPALAGKAQEALVAAGYLGLSQRTVAGWRVASGEVRAGLCLLAEEAGLPPGRRRLRDLRAVEALERLGTPEARGLLREWATNAGRKSELARAARAALDRIEKRR